VAALSLGSFLALADQALKPFSRAPANVRLGVPLRTVVASS
jgi:hypothetical protein